MLSLGVCFFFRRRQSRINFSLEFACGNIVRRILGIIRESAVGEREDSAVLTSSMFELLSEKAPSSSSDNTQTNVGIGSKGTKISKDAKADIIEGIQELIDEITNIEESVSNMSVDMIHENELILTATPDSKTVLKFLLQASEKRKFVVLVTEGFPNSTPHSHQFCKRLAKAGIETVIIPDTMVYSVMSRVGKVIIGARTVLANGSCVSAAGVASVCECAQQYRTPVLSVTGLYKLSPRYPFDIESLIEVGDTGKIVNFTDDAMVENVEAMNPLYDYIPPNHVDIYVTNL